MKSLLPFLWLLVAGSQVPVETNVVLEPNATDVLLVATHQQPGITVPRGASRVPLLSISLAAPCTQNVFVEEVTLYHRGAGLLNEMESVYLLQDQRRVSNVRGFSSRNGELTLRLQAGFFVRACETTVLYATADFATDALGEHRLEIRSKDDISASLPVTLESIHSVDSSALQVAGATVAKVKVTQLPLRTNPTYGREKTLARFRFAAQNDDTLLYTITLTNNGSARDRDIQNIVLQGSNGEVLTNTADELLRNIVRLEFNPPLGIEKGESRTVELRGNIRASRSRTIDFEIEEDSDIELE